MRARAFQIPVLAAVLYASLASLAWANAQAAELSRVMKLEEVVTIIHAEGLDYADSIERDMLPGGGGALWDKAVAQLYHAPSMLDLLQATLGEEMGPAEIEETIAFFDSPRGQSILTYENAARTAMSDPEVEDIARLTYAEARDAADPRLEQIDRFVDVNDLIDRNVAGALSSNFQFFRGLVDGGAFEMSEDEMLADVYGQEPQIRADTEEWLYGFLLMAYQPLDDDAMEAYIAFSETRGGRALNAALFEGFELMYRDISFGLGLAAARSMSGSDL